MCQREQGREPTTSLMGVHVVYHVFPVDQVACLGEGKEWANLTLKRLGYLSYLLKQAQEFVDVVGPIVQLVVGLLSLPEGDDALGAVDLRPDRTGGNHLGDIFLGLGFRQIQQLRQSCTLHTLIVLRHHSNVLRGYWCVSREERRGKGGEGWQHTCSTTRECKCFQRSLPRPCWKISKPFSLAA